MMTQKFEHFLKVESVDKELGIVFGFAMVCKENGADYWDLQEDHIPERTMMVSLADFMENSRVAKEMHIPGEEGVLKNGSILFAFPLTTEVAQALGITTKRTGAIIGMKPGDPVVLGKFADGTYKGFSIGGERLEDEEVA